MKIFLSILQISLFKLMIFNPLIAATTCPPDLSCPSGVQYPYTICPLGSDGKAIYLCAEDPHNIPDLDWPYSPQRVTLPICAKSHVDAIPGSVSIPSGNQIFSQQKAIDDYNRATFEWNCICGKQGDDCESGCRITLYFSANETDFDSGVLALANTNYQLYTCSVFCANSFIMFNNTNSFRTNSTSVDKTFFINEDFITPEVIESIYSSGEKVYSFYDVALHEIGHILGLDHPDELACDPVYQSVMNSTSHPVKNKSDKPNLHDKCMFKKLYCPELTSVDEHFDETRNSSIYPNPSQDAVTIEFYVQRNDDIVSIDLYNNLGAKIFNILEYTKFNSGSHKINVQTDKFSSGTYYYSISIGSSFSIKPLIIIK